MNSPTGHQTQVCGSTGSSTASYHRDYYQNHYKEIISNKKSYCECCQKTISAWNTYKHKQSVKHKLNCMTEDDKNAYHKALEERRINKRIAKLQQQLQREKKEDILVI